MHAISRVWNNLEEWLVAFLLAGMTLVTFSYVVFNNLYTVFYSLGDSMPFGEDLFFAMGDGILFLAQEMTWSVALTKAMFGWLIFVGLAWGVRIGAHIGVDLLVRQFSRDVQRVIAVIALIVCLGYTALMAYSSEQWVATLFSAGIGAEDLDRFGIQQWHIVMIVPIGFALMFVRFLQIFIRVLQGKQYGLGLHSEADDALKLADQGATAEQKTMTIAFLFIALFVLMFIGIPVAISLGLSGAMTILFFSNDSVRSLAIKLFETSEHYTLLAIPFFLLSGAFMTTGGVARRLIDFANACVGHIKGGLAIAAILACTLFAALCGSSPATVAAVGSIVIAGMVRSGYKQEFAAGIVCNAGTLGILIPPSIVMVVYATATETSVGKLFMAGVVPGLLLCLVLMVTIYIIARIKNMPSLPRASFKEILEAGRKAIWGLLLIVIILGGIYSGMFTPTEAAAVAAVYAAFVAIFIYKDMTIRECPKVFVEAGKLSVVLMFIIANAMLFAHVLTTEQIPQSITAWVVEQGFTPIEFLLVVNIVLLVAGTFMEPSAIILILAPILFPIAMQLGIDPIHLGIIMVVNMEIGLITPPTGLNLFVTSAVTGMPLTRTIVAVAPWVLVMLAFLVLVTYVPFVSLALPNWLGM